MSCWTCVAQSEAGIIESFGKFNLIASPGCHCLVPCRDKVSGSVSLRLQSLEAQVESKSSDNVFLQLKLSVQFQVLPKQVATAYYTLSNYKAQIISYLHHSVRGKVPKYTLDNIYTLRDEISLQVKQEIDAAMETFGYDIIQVLIVDIFPAKPVQDAMNKIQTYSRLKTATVDKAEAGKIQVIKAAEADAESKRLSGVGLGEQRKAIVAGLQSSVEDFKEGVRGLDNNEVVSLLLLNQYFDTLKEVAQESRSTTLMLSHTGGLQNIAHTMQQGIFESKAKQRVKR